MRAVAELDWSQPPELGTWFETIRAPALVEAGLPLSRPARSGQPALRGVRLHDCARHTFPRMQLSAGVHLMQVSQWLGHAQHSLTLVLAMTGFRARTEARSTTCSNLPRMPKQGRPNHPMPSSYSGGEESARIARVKAKCRSPCSVRARYFLSSATPRRLTPD